MPQEGPEMPDTDDEALIERLRALHSIFGTAEDFATIDEAASALERLEWADVDARDSRAALAAVRAEALVQAKLFVLCDELADIWERESWGRTSDYYDAIRSCARELRGILAQADAGIPETLANPRDKANIDVILAESRRLRNQHRGSSTTEAILRADLAAVRAQLAETKDREARALVRYSESASLARIEELEAQIERECVFDGEWQRMFDHVCDQRDALAARIAAVRALPMHDEGTDENADLGAEGWNDALRAVWRTLGSSPKGRHQ